MRDLDTIGEELFNKIRGRFPSVSIGTAEGQVTNEPSEARFFDFSYENNSDSQGKVSVSLSEEEGVVILFNSDSIAIENGIAKSQWYGFLKELRKFARKRALNFETRDIERDNLQKRDYSYLATSPGDDKMTESKMYGTSKVSFQDIGNARLRLQHTQRVNNDIPAGRTQHIEGIFIESDNGERFKYPFKHISGARAMARHVSEGGVPHDEFGKHITGLSEELANLKKFKTYMGRSSVMAEGLGQYMDVVKERVITVKNRINKLQKENFYKEEIETFESSELTEVPEDVKQDWIKQLTIEQFNEELKDVFPYIYKLIGESGPKELNADDLVGEDSPKTSSYTRAGQKEWNVTYDEGKKKNIKTSFLTQPNMNISQAAELFRKKNRLAGNVRLKYVGIAENDIYMNSFEKTMNEIGNYPDDFDQGAFDRSQGTPEPGEERAQEEVMDEIKNLIQNYDYSRYDDLTDPDDIKGYMSDAASDLIHTAIENVGAEGFYDGIMEYFTTEYLDQIKDQLIKNHPNNAQECPDGEEEEEKPQTPLPEYILSLFDRDNGRFPKGETAVLTAIEKDYGNEFINPAKNFIERIQEIYREHTGITVDSDMEPLADEEQQRPYEDITRMKTLAGLTLLR